jgi:hypothetical protein
MGTWGTSILGDDTAADVAAEFKDSIAYGKTIEEAEDQLIADFCIDDEEDPYAFCPFWLGLAAKQVQMGRLSERTKTNALRIIDEGIDIAIWKEESPKDVKKRQAALDKLRAQIVGPQKEPTKVRKPFLDPIEWKESDGLAYQLPSGMWTAFHVIKVERNIRYHSADYAVLDIYQDQIPKPEQLKKASLRYSSFTINELERVGLIRPPITGKYPEKSINEIRTLLPNHEIKINKWAGFALGGSMFCMSRMNSKDGPTGQLIKVTSGLKNKYKFVAGGSAFGGWKDLDAHLENEYNLK